jgi:hypothetical protein
MSLFAFDPKNVLAGPIHIDKWIANLGEKDGLCGVCHEPVSVRAMRSMRQTHFVHASGSTCPTVIDSRKPFEWLTALPRDPSVEALAKDYVLKHLEAIYLKCKDFAPGLSWKEFLALLQEATKLRVWSLKDMPTNYLPYVLLTCVAVFPANKFGRPRDICFALEPSPLKGDVWNFPSGRKRYLWVIDHKNRSVEHHAMEFNDPWYRVQATTLLK